MAKTPAKKAPDGQETRRAPASKPGAGKVTITEHFKLVFVVVTLLTLTFFATAVVLGVTGHGEMSNKCFMLVTAGFGAVIGLIGGKTL